MLAASCWIHIKYLWVEMQLPSDISKKATWYVPYLLTFCLLYLWRFFVAEVRLGTLWSCACCPGPAGKTAIYRLQLRSGGGGGGRRCGEGGEGEGCGTADIRSNNPHLIGGEKNSVTVMQKMMTLYDTKRECFHYSSSRLSTTSSSFFPSTVYICFNLRISKVWWFLQSSRGRCLLVFRLGRATVTCPGKESC